MLICSFINLAQSHTQNTNGLLSLGLAGEYLNVIWGKYKQKQPGKMCGCGWLAFDIKVPLKPPLWSVRPWTEGTDRRTDRGAEWEVQKETDRAGWDRHGPWRAGQGETRRDPWTPSAAPGGGGRARHHPPTLHRLTPKPSKFQITENRRQGKKKKREFRRAEQSRAAA